MSTQPDPQLVREIARKAALLAARRVDDVDTAIDRSGAIGDRPEAGPELAAWRQARGALYSAVRAQVSRAQVVVSWPDEQAQDERDDDVRAVDHAIWLIDALWAGDARGDDVASVRAELTDRFADRIAALDARTTDGGAG